MTTRENVTVSHMLSEVEKQIRKDIPRLMELREGCWVHLINDLGKTLGSVKVLSNVNDGISYLNETLTRIEYRSKEFFEIIGHDIMLNDVLEWLDKKADNPDDRYFQDLGYTTNNGFLECWREDKILFKWNLQTPYFKDQSEELIKFLYNLIS